MSRCDLCLAMYTDVRCVKCGAVRIGYDSVIDTCTSFALIRADMNACDTRIARRFATVLWAS
jgi:hypothetical protein